MENREARKVLVIAAHPDDELLGCGGTLALHVEKGDSVTVVIMCEGESLRYKDGEVDQTGDIAKAAAIMGIRDVRALGFPDQRLDTLSLVELITPLEAVVREIQPSIVYCQYGGDINRDHYLLFEATLVATRPVESCIQAVYAFDTASSTDWAYPRTFIPDTWVDISTSLERKLAALACYRSEMRDFPHPRSIESLRNRASHHGSHVCVRAAEPFMTVRRVLRNGETPV